MTEGAGRLGRRLRRILLLLPYAIRHPGVTVDELSTKFGVPKRELIDDLNLVFLCGLPGYGPGDLIDVTLDENRVFVRMADYFSAPLRLTPAEALVLYASGAAMAALPGMEEADALKRAIAKLGRALGARAGDAGIDVRLEDAPPEHLQTLQRALSKRRRVALEYLSASRGELTQRKVDPWGLIAALGRWYLVAWDREAEDERMFRLDRVKSAVELGEPADVPSDFDPHRYRGAFSGAAAEVATLQIAPSVARWFTDYYSVKASRSMPEGWVEVDLATSSARWVATLVLRLGDQVRVVRPAAVLDEARALARAIADRYEEPSPA